MNQQRNHLTKRAPAIRSSGFLLVEVATMLLLLGLLLTVTAQLTLSYSRGIEYYLAHEKAELAAESYLESLRAGIPPNEEDGVRYEVRRDPGEGNWAGLVRVTVTAIVEARGRKNVQSKVVAYLEEEFQ